jgi:hypothetical protein
VIGSALCALVALAFLALGVGSYAAPAALAENYGLPVSNTTEIAYLRALGTRDFVLGLLVARFLRSASDRDALRSTIAVSALVAAGDFAVVFRTRGPSAKAALAIHGSGIVGLLLIRELLAREL